MNGIIRQIIREIIKESVNIDDQGVLYFGKADDDRHIVLDDKRIRKKVIPLNNVMGIENTTAKFNFDEDTGEINFEKKTESIPRGDLRIEAFSLYNSRSFNENSPYKNAFNVLDIAKIMKNQFDFEGWKSKPGNEKYKNLRIEQFPEYSAARDFLQNDLIEQKIRDFNPDIILFPESSSAFNQILKEMMIEMLPDAEVLSTLKQTMLTSFNVEKAEKELKRNKLRQALVEPDVFEKSSPVDTTGLDPDQAAAKIAKKAQQDANARRTGVADPAALKSINDQMFRKVERIIRQTAMESLNDSSLESEMPAVKIHDVGSLSQMQGWRTFISNLHRVCYDRTKFPVQRINVINTDSDKSETLTLDVPKIMMSIAFCYGMVLFYNAAIKVSSKQFKNTDEVEGYTIRAIKEKMSDLKRAQLELSSMIDGEQDDLAKNELQSQLDIIDNQILEIQPFIDQSENNSPGSFLQSSPSSTNQSELESAIEIIEKHVLRVYEGISITKDDLVNIQTPEELFELAFQRVIDFAERKDNIKTELQDLFNPSELQRIHARLSDAISKERKSSKYTDPSREESLRFFNSHSIQISTMINQFLLDNLAEVIVANMGQITFPIKAEDLASSLVEDPLAIFRNRQVEIGPGVYAKMENNDLELFGSTPDIDNGNEFSLKVFDFILEKIIVINTDALERSIEDMMRGQEAKGFSRILNKVNRQFDVPIMKNILIVDDNIATGATLAIIANSINDLVAQGGELNFDIVEYPTNAAKAFRSVDRDVFNKVDAALGKRNANDIPNMSTVLSAPKDGKIGGENIINIDSLLKNIICLTPIII